MIKKYSFLFLSLFFVFPLVSQNLTVKNDKSFLRYDNYLGQVDYLLLFNEINNNTEISFEPAAGHTFRWFNYSTAGILSEISNQNFISPENNTGYVVEIDGVKKWIWVLDYTAYLPSTALKVIPGETPCSSLTLALDGQFPVMSFVSRTGSLKNIDRKLDLTYKSLNWSNDNWSDKTITTQVDAYAGTWLINEVPLQNTRFELTGDAFASELGLSNYSIESDEYEAVKLEVHVLHQTTVRKEKNEANNPSDSTVTTGSAPLEINFTAKVSSDKYNGINWTIRSEGAQIFSQLSDELRYTFNEAGSFYVKARVANSQCEATDSVLVRLDESAIYAPNAFTPNGDGINDEFRVAYKSIITFRCDVFNRWGKKVFSWTNPQKGWDGSVNGVPAKPGPYFYVIQAVGSEGKKYQLKGDINLLRGK